LSLVVVLVFCCRHISICALWFAAAAEFDLSLLLSQKKKKKKKKIA
jgi:hypothetical protein